MPQRTERVINAVVMEIACHREAIESNSIRFFDLMRYTQTAAKRVGCEDWGVADLVARLKYSGFEEYVKATESERRSEGQRRGHANRTRNGASLNKRVGKHITMEDVLAELMNLSRRLDSISQALNDETYNPGRPIILEAYEADMLTSGEYDYYKRQGWIE